MFTEARSNPDEQKYIVRAEIVSFAPKLVKIGGESRSDLSACGHRKLSAQFAIEQKLQIVKDRRQNYGVYHHISFTSECLVVCKCISITLTSSIEQMRAQPSI